MQRAAKPTKTETENSKAFIILKKKNEVKKKRHWTIFSLHKKKPLLLRH